MHDFVSSHQINQKLLIYLLLGPPLNPPQPPSTLPFNPCRFPRFAAWIPSSIPPRSPPQFLTLVPPYRPPSHSYQYPMLTKEVGKGIPSYCRYYYRPESHTAEPLQWLRDHEFCSLLQRGLYLKLRMRGLGISLNR